MKRIKNNIFLFLSILLVLIIILVVILVLRNNSGNIQKLPNTNSNLIVKENLEFEINSDLNLFSLFQYSDEIKIMNDDEKIDTSSLGAKQIKIKYLHDEIEKELIFDINIVDKKAPSITYVKEVFTYVGQSVDLLRNVSATDNSNELIKVKVEGSYNFNKVGIYNLKFVAIDTSGNRSEEGFVLKVLEKKINNSIPNSNSTNNNNDNNSTNNSSSTNINNGSNNNSSGNNQQSSTNNNSNVGSGSINNNTNTESIAKGKYISEEAKKLFDLINNKRSNKGLSKLKWNSSLENSAKVRAKELVVSFSSLRPNNTTFYTAITASYIKAAEVRISSGATANSLIDQIEALDDYTDVGISLYYDSESQYKYYWSIIYAKMDNTPAGYRQDDAKTMLALVNKARRENGLNELEWNSSLENSAKVRAKELVTFYSHTRPNKSKFSTAITISYRIAGENIAAGQESVNEVFEAWMNSEGHRANILNSSFTDIGISWYYEPNSTYKYHWVQLFAGF